MEKSGFLGRKPVGLAGEGKGRGGGRGLGTELVHLGPRPPARGSCPSPVLVRGSAQVHGRSWCLPDPVWGRGRVGIRRREVTALVRPLSLAGGLEHQGDPRNLHFFFMQMEIQVPGGS